MILNKVLYTLEKRKGALTIQGFISLSDLSQEGCVFYSRVQKYGRM